MISTRLPLNTLRAFEATARHLSVKNAANELCVTPSAISQMIKTLELHLGVLLFQRANRGVFLTDAGRSYLPAVRNAFKQIAEASYRIASSAETGLLTVSVTPFFATAWLIPRLGDFHRSFPEIDLQVVTSNARVDFSRSGVEIAVRHGLGRYPGLSSDRVIAVEVVPVAARSLAQSLGIPKSATELARWPLVHDAERKGWHRWFEAHGIEQISALRGPSYDDSSLLLQAIQGGQGAGLLPAAMVEADITKKRLVRLATEAFLEEFAYYLVCPAERRDQPKISAFRSWILQAAAKQISQQGNKDKRSYG